MPIPSVAAPNATITKSARRISPQVVFTKPANMKIIPNNSIARPAAISELKPIDLKFV
jgi:hypothetical protein